MTIIILFSIFLFSGLRLIALDFPLTSDAGIYNYRGKLFKKNIQSYWIVQIYVVFLYYLKNLIFDSLKFKIKEPYKEFIFRFICDLIFIILFNMILYKFFGNISIFGMIILILFTASPSNPWYVPFSDFFEFTLFIFAYLLLLYWGYDRNYIFLLLIGAITLLLFYCKWLFSLMMLIPLYLYILLESNNIVFDLLYLFAGFICLFVIIFIAAVCSRTTPMIIYTFNIKKILKCLVSQRTEEYGLYKGKGKICEKRVNLIQKLTNELKENYYLYFPILIQASYFPFIFNKEIVILFYIFLALTFFCSYLSIFLYGRKIFFIGAVAFVFVNNFYISINGNLAALHKQMILILNTIFFLIFILKNFKFVKAKTILEKYTVYYPSVIANQYYYAGEIGEYIKNNLKITERFYIQYFQWFAATVAHISERKTVEFENTYDILFHFMAIFSETDWEKKIIDDINEKKIEIILLHINEEPIIFKYLKFKYQFINQIRFLKVYRRLNIENELFKEFDINAGDYLFNKNIKISNDIVNFYYLGFGSYSGIIGNIFNEIRKKCIKAIYCNNERTIHFIKYLYEINGIKVDYIIDKELKEFNNLQMPYNIEIITDTDILKNKIEKIFVNSKTNFSLIKKRLEYLGIPKNSIIPMWK